jgi:hypothetical protein
MGVRSYFEGLFKNLNESLTEQEKYSKGYVEHIIHGQPLSAEAQASGEAVGMDAAMPLLTFTPKTTFFRDIIENLAGTEPGMKIAEKIGLRKKVLRDDILMETARKIGLLTEPETLKDITVKSGKNLKHGVAGQVHHFIPGLEDETETARLLNEYAKGKISDPGFKHDVMLKPHATVEREAPGIAAKKATAAHELLGHLRSDFYTGYSPLKKVASEAKEKNLKQHLLQQHTSSAIYSPQEINAENIGHLYTQGSTGLTKAVEGSLPEYSNIIKAQYTRDMENIFKYRAWKRDKVLQHRERLAKESLQGNPITKTIAEETPSTMTGTETRKAESVLEKMGLFQRPPAAVKGDRATEILRKMGLSF